VNERRGHESVDKQGAGRRFKIALLLARWIIAAVFLYAGVVKILDPAAFAVDINNYRLMPYPVAGMTAAVLPWLEVMCAGLLVSGRWMRGAALILVALNTVFLLAILSAMVRGLDISCGCFGSGPESSSVGIRHLVEDLLLLLGSAWILLHALKRD